LFSCAKHFILPRKTGTWENESQVPMVRIPQRKGTKCNTYNHSFFFTIVFLQFSIKFYFGGWIVLGVNKK